MSRHYSVERLRRGVAHFLIGKVGSAGLNFIAFLLVARLLPHTAYGQYVSLVALVELGLNLAAFGLDWVSARYVPEYRTQASSRALVRLVLKLSGLQALALAFTGLVLLVTAPWLTAQLDIPDALPAARLYSAYLVVEGVSRVLRDQMLAHLLLQGRAQAALVLRHGIWVGLLVTLWLNEGNASLFQVAAIELAAAATGLITAIVGLAMALRQTGEEGLASVAVTWKPPSLSAMRQLALNSYLAFLMNVPARPQIITLLVVRMAGPEVAALYGFARNLSDQVLRFLPAELLLGFFRPALVARYVAHRQAIELNRQTNALLLLSLLVLAPVLALALGCGSLLVQVLGGGRFDGSAPVLALLLIGVALFSHRRMLEFVANTVGQPQAVGRASLVLLVVPLGVWALLRQGVPVWAVPLAVLSSELLFGQSVMLQLRRAGVPYHPPLAGLARTISAILLAAVALPLAPLPSGVVGLAIAGILALLLTAGAAWAFKALDAETLRLLRSFTRKQGSTP